MLLMPHPERTHRVRTSPGTRRAWTRSPWLRMFETPGSGWADRTSNARPPACSGNASQTSSGAIVSALDFSPLQFTPARTALRGSCRVASGYAGKLNKRCTLSSASTKRDAAAASTQR